MSSAKPQILCWQVCDAVHTDPATGKHYILGCFSAIRARQFPAQHGKMIWFLTLSDVPEGEHQLRILFGPDVVTTTTIVERTFQSTSPLQKINLINEIRNLKLEQAGNHAIVIEVDNDPIMVTNLQISN
jgi:hypothetical protein